MQYIYVASTFMQSKSNLLFWASSWKRRLEIEEVQSWRGMDEVEGRRMEKVES
jgi:hypothetical protein